MHEEYFWRQQTRCLWLKAGDWNNAFFHKHVEARTNYKLVLDIQTHDQVIQDFDKIKMEASRYFKAIYSVESDNIPPNTAIMDLVPKLVKRKDNNTLMQKITLDELKTVVEDMEEDKAPGPDIINENSSKCVGKLCTRIFLKWF